MSDIGVLTDPHVAALLPYVIVIVVIMFGGTCGVLAMAWKIYSWLKKEMGSKATDAANVVVSGVKTELEAMVRELRAHIADETSWLAEFTSMKHDVADVRERMIRVEDHIAEMRKQVDRMEDERRLRHEREVAQMVTRGTHEPHES